MAKADSTTEAPVPGAGAQQDAPEEPRAAAEDAVTPGEAGDAESATGVSAGTPAAGPESAARETVEATAPERTDSAGGTAASPGGGPESDGDGDAAGAQEARETDGADVSRGPRRIAVLLGVAALAYVLDLCAKLWVVADLEGHRPIDVLGHYLQLDATRNAGAAFGFGQGMTVVFTLIAAAVIVVIARIARRLRSVPWAIALGLLLGGALGNLTDRIFRAPGVFRGHVVDFIAPEHFAIFNLADSAIVCGGCLIVLLSFLGLDPDGGRARD
jgi:signal peptidase II